MKRQAEIKMCSEELGWELFGRYNGVKKKYDAVVMKALRTGNSDAVQELEEIGGPFWELVRRSRYHVGGMYPYKEVTEEDARKLIGMADELEKGIRLIMRKHGVRASLDVIASELVKIAKGLVSMEFDTEEEKKKYQREHKVRHDTQLKVKPKSKDNPKEEEESVRDEWFHHPFSKERMLYHGTSKKHWEQIQKDGHLTPHEASEHEDGASVWFTTSVEQAREYSKKGGVIIGIKHGDALEHRHHRYVSLPHEMVREWKKNPEKWGGIDKLKEELHDWNFVVHENIPLSKVKVMDFGKAPQS